ncbi:MAG: FIST C-terminal domain-containing protein [Magnetococcales bacterium]|nr:FIST C-terminal domain-containing protein [Magnetococcales bacterium]
MLLATCHYRPGQGWDTPPDPAWDSERTLLILFGAPDARPLSDGVEDLRRAFRAAAWIGCSTSGEMHGDALLDGALVVAVMRFEHTEVRVAREAIQGSEESAAVGGRLAAGLAAPDLMGVFVLSDGLVVNGSSLVQGLTAGLPAGMVITGGLAGDGDRFRRTWVMDKQGFLENHVVAAGFYGGRIRIAHGSRGGWDILGPERRVTSSRGNVLYTLDGQPALALYKKYLGERASGLPATGLLFPLAIRNPSDEANPTVRTILAVDETHDSITFAGDVPQGCTVRLMRANMERLIDGAADASRMGIASAGTRPAGQPLLCVAISCVGRRLVLGQRTEEEIEAVLHGLPAGSELIGYYSYGELSPLANGLCDLHNQTMTLTLLWEA